VMRLLGHRDYRMTLRYTAITPETVSNEYQKALVQIATRYRLPTPSPSEPAPAPDNSSSTFLAGYASMRATPSPARTVETHRASAAGSPKPETFDEDVGAGPRITGRLIGNDHCK